MATILDKLVEPVSEEDIPEPLKQRFSDEKWATLLLLKMNVYSC